MPVKYPVGPQPAEVQVQRVMLLLQLYGCPPKHDLWHAVDYAVMSRNKKIAKLEAINKLLRERLRCLS